MALNQLRNVNFGKSKSNATGSTGVGYALLDISGSVTSTRTTTGVYQLTSGSGLYAAYIQFPNEFRGQILWDTGAAFSEVYYATEQFNVEENNPVVRETYNKLSSVSGSIETIRQFTEGRWIIDETTKRMNFYDNDNTTLIASFELFDSTGSLNVDSVFERRRL